MTPNKEDYLKCIYEIGIDLHKITNKEIAARMQVSPPPPPPPPPPPLP
ncbi:iron-dependent transcriptional regulator [Streptococcus pneumoniae]|nr:iron-dependent transcriptional regulator [Streptococcus pneumoniae]